MRNLIDSPLGNRWRLDDLDRPVAEDNGAMWIGDDGTFTMTDRHGGQSQFDQDGLLTSRQDRVGNTTTFSYIDLDSDGVPDWLSQTVDPAGCTMFAYVDGWLDAITDYAGRVTKMTYDAADERHAVRPLVFQGRLGGLLAGSRRRYRSPRSNMPR